MVVRKPSDAPGWLVSHVWDHHVRGSQTKATGVRKKKKKKEKEKENSKNTLTFISKKYLIKFYTN